VGSEYLGNIAERRIAQRGEHPSRYHTQFDVLEAFRTRRLA
jgi:hypothetical protein